MYYTQGRGSPTSSTDIMVLVTDTQYLESLQISVEMLRYRRCQQRMESISGASTGK